MNNGAATTIAVLLVAASLGGLAWLCYRVLRWARAGRSGARATGEILTAVTQSAVVREAKQGETRKGQRAGDPPSEE
jgi:hypothetical protein